jgi:hypothetical protein
MKRLVGESAFTPTRQYSARNSRYCGGSDNGSMTPGGLSTSTQGVVPSSAASHRSDETVVTKTKSAGRFSLSKLQQQDASSPSGDVLLHISLGGGASDAAADCRDPFGSSFAGVATAPLELVADCSHLDDDDPAPMYKSSARGSQRRPHPPSSSSSTPGGGGGAASGGPRLTIKSLEARQSYQLRLLRHYEQQRCAAVATIMTFYRQQKQRRVAREAFRKAREAVIVANIASHRHTMLQRKFRSLVTRHARRSHNPTQHWRWVRLQAWVRGFLSRKTFLKMQLAARSVSVTASAALSQAHAAIVIQTNWKRYFVQRRLVNVSAFLSMRRNHAARIIQRFVRQSLFCNPAARKRAAKTSYRQYRAASNIQRCWRLWQLNFRQRIDTTRTRRTFLLCDNNK